MVYQFSEEYEFWEKHSNIWSGWDIGLPDTQIQNSSQTFRIITPFFNAKDYLRIHLYSLSIQLNTHFRSYLTDDCSTDGSADIVNKIINFDNRFSLNINSNKQYALENIARTIDAINDIDDEDIIILL